MSPQDEQPRTQSGSVKTGFIVLFSLLFVIAALLAVGFWQYTQTTMEIKKQTTLDHDTLTTLQQSVDNLRQSAEKALALSAQQEQMINDWKAAQKGDLNKWYVAEAMYLTKLANDHLQFSHNTLLALTLLQRADDVLKNLQDASVMEIRKSLTEKISNLQQLPKVDVTGLYLELSALNKQIDQLSLPAQPLKPEQQKTAPLAENAETEWWQRGWDQTLQALQKIVIVRNDMKNALPLVLPEEKIFLYQNLHAQLENAMWGALHRNMDVYKASLARALLWVKLYFDQDAQATQTMLQNLTKLQEVNIQPPVVSLAPTLQLFNNYLTPTAT